MADIDPRFEFRVWHSDLSAARARLASLCAPGRPRQSEETYILSAATDAANVKIRDEKVDIKQLVEVRSGLERWNPVLKSPFPIETRIVVEQVMPALEVAPTAVSHATLTLEQFLREAVEPQRDLRPVTVTKTRFGFDIDGCIAEYAEVRIAGAGTIQTVEIESTNLDAIHGVIAKLGLKSLANVNYIRQLKLSTGFSV